MTIDVRAKIVCSLGKVISGELSDSLMLEGGLIKTSGTLILSGLSLPQRADVVQLAYYKPQSNTITRFPRALRVLNATADPFRNTTTVQIGCKLALMENKVDPKDPFTLGRFYQYMDFGDNYKKYLPTAASDLVFYCCKKCDIQLDPRSFYLNFRFQKAEFDLSSGYLSVVDDLIKSHACYAYMTLEEKLYIRKVSLQSSVSAAVLENEDLIDLQPMTGAEEPADEIRVTFEDAVQRRKV